jgi:hypothetical protein
MPILARRGRKPTSAGAGVHGLFHGYFLEGDISFGKSGLAKAEVFSDYQIARRSEVFIDGDSTSS